MRREVPTILMNEKVTYIEFQCDLWVTFDPWLFIFQGVFSHFIFPKWLLEFFFSSNYNNWKIWILFIFLIFGFFYKNNIYNISQNILQYYNFIPLSCWSVCSMPHVVIIYFSLLRWICVLSLHRGLYCTSCTPPC